MPDPVEHIFAVMGGPVSVARKLSRIMGDDVPQTSVYKWKARGVIPMPYKFIMRSHASKLGLVPLPEYLKSTYSDW